MSAFIVDKSHIDAMLRACRPHHPNHLRWFWHGWQEITLDNADAVGQMLLDTNIASVQERYPDDPITELPGRTDADYLFPYTFYALGRVPSSAEGLKLISCYSYQSCEHPEWEESEAKAFCEALTADLIGRLPGYAEAPWEWVEERHTQKAQRIL